MADGNSSEIFDGTVNGNTISWKVSITDPMPMTLEFNGMINDDEVTGERDTGRLRHLYILWNAQLITHQLFKPHMAKPVASSTARQKKLNGTMGLQLRIAAVVALLCAVAAVLPEETSAQDIDFGKVDKFESLATGTLHVGAPPKTIVDDGERHVIIVTIWDADAETKVYWRSPDGNAPSATVIPGRGVQTFQTLGEFKLEAVGEPHREVQYGYVLLGLRK